MITLIVGNRAGAYGQAVRPSPHVLLLNASLDESEMYAFWLKACGYRVTVAQTIAAARHLARTETVDVLVIDALFGPGSARPEVVRRWSRLAHRDCLPIVVLSGYPSDAGRASGRNTVVLKPCLPQQLSGCIEDLLVTPSPRSAASGTGKPVADCSPS